MKPLAILVIVALGAVTLGLVAAAPGADDIETAACDFDEPGEPASGTQESDMGVANVSPSGCPIDDATGMGATAA